MAPERLWSRVTKTPHCWTWVGGCTNAGYGELMIDGRMWYAHRLSWTLTHGEIPEGSHILHHCDNPPCVRPDHLYLGTDAENARDRVARLRATGGSSPGEKNPNHRFTEGDIREMRRLASIGHTQKHIGELFGTTQPCISKIIRRKTWRHVA